MDYHSMKRRELQALCKEHNIPANSSNSVLADELSKKQKRLRTCMKSTDEREPAASRREAKKVRFSPTNDLFEYELRSGKKEKDTVTETKNRRKSKEIMDAPVRVTRSRKVSDLSNNLSNVASENNQQLPRRKSSRTSGVEIATKDGSEKLKRKKTSEESSTADKESRQSRRNRAKVEDSTVLNPKVEMVVEKKVTRSKALLATKSCEGNNKNRAKKKGEVQRKSKMIVQHAGRKNVNRRESVMQPENTQVVESPNVGTHKISGKRKSKENCRFMEQKKKIGRVRGTVLLETKKKKD